MTAMSLEDRFARRIPDARKNPHSLDKDLAEFASQILDEAGRDAPGDISMALTLYNRLGRKGELPFTERVLHNVLFYNWAHGKDAELNKKLASILLKYPSFAGSSPTVSQWEEAVNVAMTHCFSAEKLRCMLALATEKSNNFLVAQAWGRYISLAPDPIKHFLGRCLDAIGDNVIALDKVSSDALVYIRVMRELAEMSIKLGLHYPTGLEEQTLDIVWPNTIKVYGIRRWPNKSISTAEDIQQLLHDLEEKLWDKWREIKKAPDSHYVVQFVIEGLPKEINLH